MKVHRTRKSIIRTWETLMSRYTELDDPNEIERLISFERSHYRRCTIIKRLRLRWLTIKREELKREARQL